MKTQRQQLKIIYGLIQNVEDILDFNTREKRLKSLYRVANKLLQGGKRRSDKEIHTALVDYLGVEDIGRGNKVGKQPRQIKRRYPSSSSKTKSV